MFSISSTIITQNRNRISSKTVRQLILLKSWELWTPAILGQKLVGKRVGEGSGRRDMEKRWGVEMGSRDGE